MTGFIFETKTWFYKTQLAINLTMFVYNLFELDHYEVLKKGEDGSQ